MSDPIYQGAEIHYGGYAFRSPLEVRWAIFFDALNIEYRYQPEEFILEGIRYLPDFYLPKWDSYVAITQGIPGDDHTHKTGLLALYADKRVYTFAGQPKLPDDTFFNNGILPDETLKSYEIYRDDPPSIITYPEEEYPASDQTKEVETLQIVKVLLNKLNDCRIDVSGNGYQFTFYSGCFIEPSEASEGIRRYVALLQKQQDMLSRLAPLLVKSAREIISTVTPKEGWTCELIPQIQSQGYRWAECSTCSNIAIIMRTKDKEYTHGKCLPGEKGVYRFDSPRLSAAYMKASQ